MNLEQRLAQRIDSLERDRENYTGCWEVYDKITEQIELLEELRR